MIPILFWFAAVPRPASAAQEVFWAAQFERPSGIAVEVTLNGVVIDKSDGATPGSMSGSMNQWLTKGDNTLVVKLRAVALGLPPSGSEGFKAALYEAAQGMTPEEGQPVAVIEWRPGDPLPFEATKRFAIATPPCDLFDGLSAAPLDTAAEAELTRITLALREALAKKNRKAFMALSDKRFKAIGACTYSDPSEAKPMVEMMMKAMKKRQPRPLSKGDLAFTPMADGRLVHVTRKDGSPAVIVVDKEGAMSVDLYFGFTGGAWHIVR